MTFYLLFSIWRL